VAVRLLKLWLKIYVPIQTRLEYPSLHEPHNHTTSQLHNNL
jgi:hypothetical protein